MVRAVPRGRKIKISRSERVQTSRPSDVRPNLQRTLTIILITITTFAHIASGAIAVVMEAITFGARKGAASHINAGRVFTAAMVLSFLLGAILGLIKFETFYITFHGGVLGMTLVMGGVLAKMQNGYIGASFAAVSCINFLNGMGLVAAGFCALTLPDQNLRGFAATDYFFLAGIAAIVFINDLVIFLRTTLSDRHRIAQHLWRMCIGFFIAAGSAFAGPGASIFPAILSSAAFEGFGGCEEPSEIRAV